MNNLSLKLKSLFKKRGFNLFKVIEAAVYDNYFECSKKSKNLLDNSQSVIIVGFMGNKFWNILNNYITAKPDFMKSGGNIIDEYSIITVNQALDFLSKYSRNNTAVYPFGDKADYLDFRTLGRLGGVGVDSILGMLINPEYGTWISFRGAILTDIVFDRYDNPLLRFNPCPSCSKPCIFACPVKSVSEKGWNWRKCLDFRVSNSDCKSTCYSRRACPYGEKHQYSNDQFEHHHKFVLKSYINYLNDKNGR